MESNCAYDSMLGDMQHQLLLTIAVPCHISSSLRVHDFEISVYIRTGTIHILILISVSPSSVFPLKRSINSNNHNTNNRKLIERFRRLKAHYNLKKNMQRANTYINK